MTAEIITDAKLWDNFIEDSPYGMLFHRWDFLKTIEKHTDHKLLTYGIYKGDTLIGVFPLFYKKAMGVKLIYSPPQGSLAYIPYMGLVMGSAYANLKQNKKEGYIDLAYHDTSREIKNLSANFVSITFGRQMNDLRPFIWDGYSIQLLYTYVTNLEQPLENIWDGFDTRCKKHIKDCDQYNLSIRESTDIDTFYDTMALSQKGHNNSIFQRQSSIYLKDLVEAFPQNIKMHFMYLDDQIIGMQVNCLYKDLFLGWMGDMVIRRDINTNEYLNWELIKMAKAAGYKAYEAWGADMKRLNQYKSKFNPTLVPYYHIRKIDRVGKLSEWGYDMMTSNPYLNFIKNKII